MVRTTAAEIRKKLAQYYLEPGHENELRVLLPQGSYLPEFRPPPCGPRGIRAPPAEMRRPSPARCGTPDRGRRRAGMVAVAGLAATCIPARAPPS